MTALFQPSRLICECCSDQGYVETGLGRLACLGCSAAAALTWIPASQPPVCEPNPPASRSIQCLGAVVFDGSLMHDLVAYWPARDRWTATRLDGMEPADIEVEVSHYIELPELPQDTWKILPSQGAPKSNAVVVALQKIWIAAGGKAGDDITQDKVTAAVKAMRVLCDKFVERMVSQLGQEDLCALIKTCEAQGEHLQAPISPITNTTEGSAS